MLLELIKKRSMLVIDHLLILEEDFTQDLPYNKQSNVQTQPDSMFGQHLSNTHKIDNKKYHQRII